MIDIEKFIQHIELESYARETLMVIVQFIDKKIQKDMPGVKLAVRIEFGIMDNRTPRRKKK